MKFEKLFVVDLCVMMLRMFADGVFLLCPSTSVLYLRSFDRKFLSLISRSHDPAAITALQSTCQRDLVSAVLHMWVLVVLQCNLVESGSYKLLLCQRDN